MNSNDYILSFQTLMNVLKKVMNAMNTVTTPLAAILATVVDLVINFTVMVECVKVSKSGLFRIHAKINNKNISGIRY